MQFKVFKFVCMVILLSVVVIVMLINSVDAVESVKKDLLMCEAYNPPAYPRCPWGGCDAAGDFIVRSDFLWWRVVEEGIALGDMEAVSEWTIPFGRNTIRNVSRLKKMQFHNKPGFRLGIERVCTGDCWGGGLNWTHFHSKATAHAGDVNPLGNPEITFISFWERGADLFPLDAESSWKFGMDLFDLQAGHLYYISSCMALKPFFGLRGARITQTYSTEAVANGGLDIGESGSFISRTKSRVNFTAIGPRMGLSMDVDMVFGWSIVGEAAASLVFGRSERHSREYNTQFAFDGQSPVHFEYQTSHGLEHSTKAITDLILGLHWDRCIEFCRRFHVVQFFIAWEHHLFTDLNTFDFASQGIAIRSAALADSSSKKHGDLSIQGLTASLQIGF